MNTTSGDYLISINLFLDHNHIQSVLMVAAQSTIDEVIYMYVFNEYLEVQ